MKLRKRRGKSFHPGAIRELNLVAMMDMLTVVVIFLLKSYSVSAMSIPVGDVINVPKSSNTTPPQEAVKLTVTKATEGQTGVIAVDDERVIELDKGTLGKLESQAKKRDFTLPELSRVLERKAKGIQFIASKNPSIKFEGKILVIADKDTPYWLVTQVLYTAAEAGFEQYNLAAMRLHEE
ncbi:MAG: biopolymer transporter ExbD [Pseudomonadota bacterium]